MIRLLAALLAPLAMVNCRSSPAVWERGKGWASDIENRSVSRVMGTAVERLALGQDKEWDEISGLWRERRLDGIAATCFVVGLGELLARAPHIFLERHLAGDTTAKELAREGYRLLYSEKVMRGRPFNAKVARANALRLFRQRQSMEDEATQKRIEAFIGFVTRKE